MTKLCAVLTIAGALVLSAPAAAHPPHGVHPGAKLERLHATGVFADSIGPADGSLAPTTVATILNVSDFHGRLEPTTPRIDLAGERFGGLAYLKAYFDQRAAASPTPPFIVTAGDAVGGTPLISAADGDRPTIELMNHIGFDADTLGNHNFDRGVAHMASLAELAEFPYVVANLDEPDGTPPDWTRRYVIWEVDGVRIGVTGAINEDARDLVIAGGLGDLQIAPAAERLNEVAAELHAQGVRTVIALTHYGAEPTQSGPARLQEDRDPRGGPLFRLARKVRGIDLLVGDHTYWQVNEPALDADGKPIWVVQSFPQGVSFNEVKLTLDKSTGEPLAVAGDAFPASVRGIRPDPEVAARVAEYRERVQHLLDEVVGRSSVRMPNSLARAEANIGNLVADAARASTGAQLALINSGTLRTDLTSDDERGGDGSYLISRARVFDVMPFNNQLATVAVSGAELKRMLENGVSQLPAPNGRFPQISGFEIAYKGTAQAGSRIVWARRPDCSPIDLTGTARVHTITMPDFVALGGDSYPSFLGRIAYGAQVENAVVEYLAANSPVSPRGPVAPLEQPTTRMHDVDVAPPPACSP